MILPRIRLVSVWVPAILAGKRDLDLEATIVLPRRD